MELCVRAESNESSSSSSSEERRTLKTHRRVNQKKKTLDRLLSVLEAMQLQKDQCLIKLADMTEEIEELSDKIDNLGVVPTGAARIDLADERGDSTPVVVGVTSSFDQCLKSLDLDLISEENAYIWCLRVSLWQANRNRDEGDSKTFEREEASNAPILQKSGQRQLAPSNITHPPSGFRIRKEYRALTVQERERFHHALNVLHQNKTMEFFALLHQSAIKTKGAHRGVAFLAWHRPFLCLFEEALREVDSTVSLPYWDSSIDDNMEAGPGLSVMWDNDHLGTGSGVVQEGPFANWTTPKGPLMREIASGKGSLMTQTKIDQLQNYCRLADFDGGLENAHNGVHRWVGGTMARTLAASDPVFYMHHAFIDYQWEKFREHQVSDCGINPEFDYPPTDNDNHAPGEPMDGMEFLHNIDGIAAFWTQNWYNYEDTPTCASGCGNTTDIFCDEDTNLCTSELRVNLRRSNFRQMQTMNFDAEESTEIGGIPPKAEQIIGYPTQHSTYGKLPFSGNCSKNPYDSKCPAAPRPKSQDEYIETIVRKECHVPQEIEMVEKMLRKEMENLEEYPPDSEPVFFQAAPDVPSDCRTLETHVTNLVSAIIKGKKVTNKGY